MSLRLPPNVPTSLFLLLVAANAGARPNLAQKCSAAKIRAAVRKAQADGQCYQHAALTAGSVDTGCLATAQKKFSVAFAVAEKKGGCSTVGDGDTIGGNVDACVQDIVAALPATSTSTTTSGAGSTTTTTTASAEPAGLVGITAAHNQVRAGVGVGPMTWSTALAATAQGWANTCTDVAAPIGLLDHNPNRSVGAPYYVGENIYASSGTATPQGAVTAWASEVQYYTYATNTCDVGQVCGHYTQVVWAASLEVGCGISSCPGLAFSSTIVCDYGPGGNSGGPPY